jgi:hypothetical protein
MHDPRTLDKYVIRDGGMMWCQWKAMRECLHKMVVVYTLAAPSTGRVLFRILITSPSCRKRGK